MTQRGRFCAIDSVREADNEVELSSGARADAVDLLDRAAAAQRFLGTVRVDRTVRIGYGGYVEVFVWEYETQHGQRKTIVVVNLQVSIC